MGDSTATQVADEELYELFGDLYFALRGDQDLLMKKAQTMREAETIMDLVQEARYCYRRARNLLLDKSSQKVKALVAGFEKANKSVNRALADLKKEAKTVGAVCKIIGAAIGKANDLLDNGQPTGN